VASNDLLYALDVSRFKLQLLHSNVIA